MRNFNKTKALLTLAGLTLIFSGFSPAFGEYKDVVKRNYPVEEKGTLNIRSDFGTIEVIVGNTNVVDIQVVRTVASDSPEEQRNMLGTLNTSFDHSKKKVTITTSLGRYYHKRAGGNFEHKQKLAVHHIVKVPKHFNVRLVSAEGAIIVNGIAGKVRCSTDNGEISLVSIEGTIQAKTDLGSIHAVLASQPSDDCSFVTKHGSIDIQLLKNTDAEIDAKAEAGTIIADFPADVSMEKDQSLLRTVLNAGGPKLTLRAADQNITIRTS